MSEQHCRSCRARIIWAETVRGKLIPVDPDAVYNGNIFLYQRENKAPLAVMEGDRDTIKRLGISMFGNRHISHFATCPQGTSWRKKKAGDD